GGGRTLERDRAGVRRRAAAQVCVDVRQYRALAAMRPKGLHAGLQVFPRAVEAGGNPSVELTRGALDRPRAAPRAEKYRWTPFGAGPGEEARAVHALPAPQRAHHIEAFPERREPLVVIRAGKLEVGPGRSRTHAEPQPSCEQNVQRLNAVRKLAGPSQRHL